MPKGLISFLSHPQNRLMSWQPALGTSRERGWQDCRGCWRDTDRPSTSQSVYQEACPRANGIPHLPPPTWGQPPVGTLPMGAARAGFDRWLVSTPREPSERAGREKSQTWASVPPWKKQRGCQHSLVWGGPKVTSKPGKLRWEGAEARRRELSVLTQESLYRRCSGWGGRQKTVLEQQ